MRNNSNTKENGAQWDTWGKAGHQLFMMKKQYQVRKFKILGIPFPYPGIFKDSYGFQNPLIVRDFNGF